MKGNLIDRYVMEVGRLLPEKLRADVQMELRSALQDALDERGLNAANPEDEAAVAELLKEWGKPSHVAESYGARTHLIGPELQPIYWLVLRASVLVLSIVHLVMLGLSAFNQPNIGLLISQAIGNFVNGFLVSFAMITIIFAVLERFLPELKAMAASDLKHVAQEWDPRKLPEITPDRDKVNVFELILEMVFSAAFITVINLMPGWEFPPDLAVAGELIDKLLPFIPWITALTVAEIILDVYLITQGRWQLLTRWFTFALAVGSLVVLAFILQLAPFSSVELVDAIIMVSLGLVMFFTLLDAAIKLYRALRPNTPLPWERWNLEQDIEDIGEKAEEIGQALEARFKKPGNTKK